MPAKSKSFIPPEFFMAGKKRHKAKTVGDLKTILSLLPDSLPVRADWACTQDGAYVSVYNAKSPSPYLVLDVDP